MVSAPAPYDPEVERQVLGGVLAFPHHLTDELAGALVADDFYVVSHGAIWQAIVDLRRSGNAIDVLTVKDRSGADGAELVGMQADALGLRVEHFRIVQRASLARRLQAECHATLAAIGEGEDPAEVADRLVGSVRRIDSPLQGTRISTANLDEVVAGAATLERWVIPGLLRSDWRGVVVGGEGRGKSVLERQIGACAAQGVHPFKFSEIPPVRVLIIDAENPSAAIAETGSLLVKQLRRTVGDKYDPDRLQVIHGQHLDLRRRADRIGIEGVLAQHAPELVIAGPLYQLWSRREREGYEESAEGFLRLMDSWRRRYGFALLLEHHAPQSASGTPREMRPYGSSLLLRWPEIGIGLRSDGNDLIVGRWRGDRLQNRWPDRLERGAVWPWVGRWKRAETEF